jgi:thymidylate synthase
MYPLVIIDINNCVQKLDVIEIKVLNTVLGSKGDEFTIYTKKECNDQYIIVQKMINNPSDLQLKIPSQFTPYEYYISNEDEKKIHYKFMLINGKIDKKEYPESNYLNLLEEIIYIGNSRQTRNGLTYSVFGKTIEYDISDKFPLLTSKKVFFRGIIEELLFFIAGKTDTKLLEAKGVNIWKGNTSEEFIKSVNLPYREGDMGPMYGFNWLHFNAYYTGCDADYTNQGFNQFEQVLTLLKEDPYSRRIIMTSYNPAVASDGVLYPCHGIAIQFYVRDYNGKKYVSCSMTQRSADIACGVPYNIASYAALVYIICSYLGDDYVPDRLIMNFGDIHLYEEHINEALVQIKRNPFEFPTLEIKKFDNISDLTYEHFNLKDYECHEPIKYVMKA